LAQAVFQLADLGFATEKDVGVMKIEDFQTAIGRLASPPRLASPFVEIDPLIDELLEGELEAEGELDGMVEAVESAGVVSFRVLEMFLDEGVGPAHFG